MRERATRYRATAGRIIGLVVLFFLLRIAAGIAIIIFDDDASVWGARATVILLLAFIVAVGAVIGAQVWSRRAS